MVSWVGEKEVEGCLEGVGGGSAEGVSERGLGVIKSELRFEVMYLHGEEFTDGGTWVGVIVGWME